MEAENAVFQKIPPHDTEAEQAVLSAMLMDRDAVLSAMEILQPEDFYRPDYQAVFEAAWALFHEGSPIDVITLKSKLETMQVFEKVGGVSFLANIAASTGSSANVKQYCFIVRDKSLLRKLIKSTQEISELGYSGSEKAEVVMDYAEKAIFDLMQNRSREEFASVREVAVSAFERIEQIYRSKGKLTGLPTGFADFDAKTAGLQKSDLILLAARPSMGKTAFALNLVEHAAIRQNTPTAVFSLEMSKEQLVNRMLCAEARVDAQRLRTGELADDDWPKLVQAMGPLSEAPIFIDDTPGISPGEIRSKCRKLKLECGLGLIVIDYLQLMSGNGRNDSRQQEISEISRALKAIAREMDAPVIALSQLSRACEQRADHHPMLSDLRESGAIEQDADVVVFLYRDEYYFPESEKRNMAELMIAKQRNGPTGSIDLRWFGEYTKFTSLARNG